MPLARERQSHLPCIKDLDSLDMRFLAPTGRLAFGQHTAFCPFRVAASRDALGPELGRRVRGEMDQETVRINMACAAALVHLAGGIGGLELDAHDCSNHRAQISAGASNGHEVAGSADPLRALPLTNLTSARNCAALPPLLSGLAPCAGLATLRQTFVRRSHGGNLSLPGRVNDEQWNLFSPEF